MRWNSIIRLYRWDEKLKLLRAKLLGRKFEAVDNHFFVRGYYYKGETFITDLREQPK